MRIICNNQDEYSSVTEQYSYLISLCIAQLLEGIDVDLYALAGRMISVDEEKDATRQASLHLSLDVLQTAVNRAFGFGRILLQ